MQEQRTQDQPQARRIGRHRAQGRERAHFIGGWHVEDLLGFLRELEAHGYGEVTVTAHQGAFDVRVTHTHRAHKDQPVLTEE